MENTDNVTIPDAERPDTAQSAGLKTGGLLPSGPAIKDTANEREGGTGQDGGMPDDDEPIQTSGNKAAPDKAAQSTATINRRTPDGNTASTSTTNGKGGKPVPGLSLHTRLAQMQSGAKTKSRKRKVLLYGLPALVLMGVAVYFMHRIQGLVASGTTGLRTPEKRLHLDSSARRIDPLSQSYEKEDRNRYQDSLHRAIEKDAMGHIVMDWSRLYDLRRKEIKKGGSAAPNKQEQASLRQLEDSLALVLEGIQTSKATRGASGKGSGNMTLESGATGKGTASGNAASANSHHGNRPGRAATAQPAYPTGRQTQDSGNPVFNVVHGPGSNATGSNATGNGIHGNRGGLANTATDDRAETVIARAVVHGNHKVKSGSKVAFRLLEPVTYQGLGFEKNTILIGIATFRGGRVTFANFRSKSLASAPLSASTSGSVASWPLPLVCYDTDMVAGIAVSDQSPVETEARRAGSNAFSDAANDLSYHIPYGSVARAASSLTQGIGNGKRRSREMSIDLPDNYPVLLELMPAKEK